MFCSYLQRRSASDKSFSYEKLVYISLYQRSTSCTGASYICTLAEKVKELNPGDQSMKLSDIEVAAFGSRARLEKQALTTVYFLSS
ncbi:hypothetical protein BHE74_00004446 [Ensete ventricosum]|nr:hypothetical protein BHE74_00004446 [Ensete ventricosum]